MLLPLALLLFFILGSIISLFIQLRLTEIMSLFAEPEVHFATWLSLRSALTSLLLALFLSLPAAWALARLTFPGKKLLQLCLDIPMVTPPLIAGMGLLLFLGQSGPFSWLLPGLAHHLFSPLGIIIAQTYVASAILVRTTYAAFSALDKGYLHAAYNLGLPPIKTFILIEISLIWRVLISGCVLALARALGEFGATLMLAGATRLKTETLPMAVFLNIASGDFSLAIACALLLILIALLLLGLLHGLAKNESPATH